MAKHGRNYGQGSTPSHVIDESLRETLKARAELAAATPKPKELREFVPEALSRKRRPFIDIRAP
jgi:hypothetical protein